jgi:hypothetical protein
MHYGAARAGSAARSDEIVRLVTAISNHEAARRLGGHLVGGQVVFRARGPSQGDRSACVRFDPRPPEGFIVYSAAALTFADLGGR